MFFKKKSMDGPLKQVILIRADLKLPKGKACAQAAHASVKATLNSNQDVVHMWDNQGMKKIVLRVKDEKELLHFQVQAKQQGLVASLITDAGKTVVSPGTKTALAIGPAREELIDHITKDLPMY